MTTAYGQGSSAAVILDPADPADRATLSDLRADATVEFLDALATGDTAGEARWVHYPWRRAVIRLPPPDEYRRTRLDRNRFLITDDELARLSRLRIGVVGLSVGHSIAFTLAAEGLCGMLRLSDFDEMELTNLNRVPGSVFDIGVNKAVACARRVAELDPYLEVDVQTSGVTAASIDAFLDGLDIVVEECDSLDVKVAVRDAARSRRIPLVMATSSGGLLDVERFDLEPDRPVFHGLLGEVDAAHLARLSSKDKVPHVLRIIDAAMLRPRMQASLLEVGKTLATWPQLSSEVAVGAASVAEAVRRIGLGEELRSGRIRVDIADILDDIDDPGAPAAAPGTTFGDDPGDSQADMVGSATRAMEAVAAAASRAPSGGNVQPWRLECHDDGVTIRLDPNLTSAMDVAFRGSAVAVGAAVFNARVAAAAHGMGCSVEYRQNDGPFPLTALVRTAGDPDTELARKYDAMLRRETNRRPGTARPIESDVVAALTSSAGDEQARLRLVTAPEELTALAAALAEADRVRYLTPVLHSEMISELRWPGDRSPDTGIDIRSLELDDAALALLEILRNDRVMSHLANWNAGSALGEPTRSAVTGAAAMAVVSVTGDTLVDYARGGSAMESVWITAQQHGLAVQPISPAFLYARSRGELDALSERFSQRLADLQYSVGASLGIDADESPILILRLSYAPPPSVTSRRRRTNGRAAPT